MYALFLRTKDYSYPMFCEKLRCQGPGCVADNLIHIATVADRVVSLIFSHHCETLELVRQVITAHCRVRQASLRVNTERANGVTKNVKDVIRENNN